MTRITVVCALALAITAGLDAQSGWNRYQPRKLASIVAMHRAELESDTSRTPHFAVSAQTFPTRSDVRFLGRTRPITADHQQVLRMWARMMGLDTMRVADYEEEWLFREDSTELWMPVQAVTAESMRSAVRDGMRVTVWAQWFGAVRRDGVLTWVFPIMQTESHDDPPA